MFPTTDPVLLHDETLNILIAGRDTVRFARTVSCPLLLTQTYLLQTASTLAFIVYLMCLNPHVFKRLRQEVLETFGTNEMPTFDGVKKMKYLRAVINGECFLDGSHVWRSC